MKNIIGNVRIYRGKCRSLRVYFTKDLLSILGETIVIDEKKMIIKRPTIDSTNTRSIRKRICSFAPKFNEDEFYIGTYQLSQKDEDTFKLKKISDEYRKPRGLGNRIQDSRT